MRRVESSWDSCPPFSIHHPSYPSFLRGSNRSLLFSPYYVSFVPLRFSSPSRSLRARCACGPPSGIIAGTRCASRPLLHGWVGFALCPGGIAARGFARELLYGPVTDSDDG